MSPEVGAHDDDGEAFDFFGLDEDECFEDLVHGAESSWHDDEGGGVFDEHDLADEEVVEIDEAVEVGVWVLLHGEFDVTSEREAPAFAGAAVGGFHDSWASAGHDGVPGFGECVACLLGEFVVWVVFVEAGGSEDGDAGPDEVELAEASDELCEDFECGPEFLAAEAWPFEELAFAAFGWIFPPGGCCVGVVLFRCLFIKCHRSEG